jgi:hypothetical protein
VVGIQTLSVFDIANPLIEKTASISVRTPSTGGGTGKGK